MACALPQLKKSHRAIKRKPRHIHGVCDCAHYIVTHDVADRFQVFGKKGLMVPRSDHQVFENFRICLRECLQRAMPASHVCTIDIPELGYRIWDEIAHMGDHFVISTCADMIADTRLYSHTLNINRLFSADGKMLGYGPRPGCDSLSTQLDMLVAAAQGRAVVFVEEGSFSGGTITYVVGELEKRGARVSAIVIGFCTKDTQRRIREVYKGEIIVLNEIREVIDWVPDHDFVPFAPNCGRVVGEKVSGGFAPIRTVEGHTCAFPYILPFGNISDWTSTPESEALSLSRFCLDASIELFKSVKKAGDSNPITIGDLVNCHPTTPIPVAIGAGNSVPSTDTGVVSFLQEARNRLE